MLCIAKYLQIKWTDYLFIMLMYMIHINLELQGDVIRNTTKYIYIIIAISFFDKHYLTLYVLFLLSLITPVVLF